MSTYTHQGPTRHSNQLYGKPSDHVTFMISLHALHVYSMHTTVTTVLILFIVMLSALLTPRHEHIHYYYCNGCTSMATGDINLVNGKAWPFHKVEKRTYRLSILDASISRPYSLKFLAESADGLQQVRYTFYNCHYCSRHFCNCHCCNCHY
jgi:FtsP/CotA-like multicopper oxidase with cupredoxin domain